MVCICNSLTLCRLTYKTLTSLCKCNNGWCCTNTLCICDNNWLSTFHNCYTRVRRTEVNTNDLTHDKYTP